MKKMVNAIEIVFGYCAIAYWVIMLGQIIEYFVKDKKPRNK